MAEQAPTAAQAQLRTSLATPSKHPDEDTVRFNRFTQIGQTAYQRGQFAGFLRPMTDSLVAKGAAVIAEPAPSRGDRRRAT